MRDTDGANERAGPILSGAQAEARLKRFVRDHSRLFVLTGAGCSTDSGIPDYRDADGTWKHRQPMQWRSFIGSEAARRRYWGGSLVGWTRVQAARPNPAHRALAALERAGRIATVVTQNVDGLHQQAGHRRVIDLHGRLDRVECLDCGGVMSRQRYQHQLLHLNPHWQADRARTAPDGDAELAAADLAGFRIAPCPGCAGIIRPSVVFFGESVPAARLDTAMTRLANADAVLIVGSSLMVWSGLRFVRAAGERGIPCAALNLGRTRADNLLEFRAALACAGGLQSAVGSWAVTA